MVKTSIDIPHELMERIYEYNKKHPDQPVKIGPTCVIALELKMDQVEQNDHMRKQA